VGTFFRANVVGYDDAGLSSGFLANLYLVQITHALEP